MPDKGKEISKKICWNFDRFSVTLWKVNTTVMELLVVFGCNKESTMIDFYQYHPFVSSSWTNYVQSPDIKFR